MSAWSIVIPQAVDITNLVTNPSAELATTGFTGVTNTPARTAAQQRRGAWSISYAMASGVNDGLYFGTVSLTNGVTYGFSVDVKGVAGVSYRVHFGSTAGAVLGTPTTFTATGRWQRVYVAWAENAGASRRLYITKNNSANTGTIYVDGLLCWAGAYDLLYFDGDSRGFRDGDFYWTGTPHSSAAIMRAGTRAGGQVVDMNTLGFYIRQVLGLGLAGLLNVGMATPLIGGGQYQRTIVEPRVFALAGSVHGATRQGLQQNRRSLINAVKPDATPAQQPLLLRYQATESGAAYGEPLDIPAVFKDGLQGGELAGPAENLALSFDIYMPFVALEDGHEGASLTYQTSVANANYIARRAASGAWSAIGTGASGGAVHKVLYNPYNGLVYIFGAFTSFNGVANTAGACVYDPVAGTISALGTGISGGAVYDAAFDSSGNVITVGSFTGAGGVANTSRIALWSRGSAAWQSVSSAFTGTEIRSIAIAAGGTYLIGGVFSNVGGVAMTNVGQRSSAGTWSALGAGISGVVWKVAIGLDGTYYAATDNASNELARYSGGAWAVLDSTLNSQALGLLTLGDGRLLALGTYSLPGYSPSLWNGAALTSIGGNSAVNRALNGDTSVAARLADGLIAIGGSGPAGAGPTTMLGITIPSTFVYTNLTAWFPPDISLPSAAETWALESTPYGDLYVGYGASGTATAAAINTLTNSGTHDAYPTFRFTGPGAVYSLKNYTTGDALHFNLTLLAGEVAYLDLTPGAIRFSSNFRPNLLGAILPGSSLATWRLIPGANTVGLFVAGTTDGNTAAWAYWRKPHWSLDGAAN